MGTSKPLDIWLGLVGIAVGIVLYLVPKTPGTVVACLISVWLCLAHPTWNLWWIEKRMGRRIAAEILLLGLVGLIGVKSWPKPSADTWHIGIGPVAAEDLVANEGGADTGTAEVFFLTALTNNGPPSSALGYRLSIKSRSVADRELQPFVLSPGASSLTMRKWPTERKFAIIRRDGFLYDRTLRPIATGETVCGWLVFDVPKATAKQVLADAEWTLSFHDGFGNVHQRTFDTSKWPPVSDGRLPTSDPCAEQVYQH